MCFVVFCGPISELAQLLLQSLQKIQKWLKMAFGGADFERHVLNEEAMK